MSREPKGNASNLAVRDHLFEHHGVRSTSDSRLILRQVHQCAHQEDASGQGSCVVEPCWNDASIDWDPYCEEHGFDRHADRGNVW